MWFVFEVEVGYIMTLPNVQSPLVKSGAVAYAMHSLHPYA